MKDFVKLNAGEYIVQSNLGSYRVWKCDRDDDPDEEILDHLAGERSGWVVEDADGEEIVGVYATLRQAKQAAKDALLDDDWYVQP